MYGCMDVWIDGFILSTVCIYVSTYMCMLIACTVCIKYALIYALLSVCICTMYVRINTYIHTYTYIHEYIQIHTYIHTCFISGRKIFEVLKCMNIYLYVYIHFMCFASWS